MTADAHAAAARAAVQRSLAGQRRPLREYVFHLALLVSVALALAFLVALLTYVVVHGWDRLDANLFLNQPTALLRRIDEAGVQSAIFGTLWVISLTALFCIPTGVLAAIYLEEYGRREMWFNRLIELNIQNLAAVPSIVYGILALGLIARPPLNLGFTVITAALTLSLLVLPILIISSREAIRAVPNSIRDGSLALGATQWQTIRRQVLPVAVPGIATGTILALSRAIGEAAPLLLLGAVQFVTFNPSGPDSSYTVLPIQIFNLATRPQEGFRTLGWAAIIVLLAILLLMNSVAIAVRNRYQKRW
jgi:phosphate transport system permease protein